MFEVYQGDRLIGTVPTLSPRSTSFIFDVRRSDFRPEARDGKTVLVAAPMICPGDFAVLEGFTAAAGNEVYADRALADDFDKFAKEQQANAFVEAVEAVRAKASPEAIMRSERDGQLGMTSSFRTLPKDMDRARGEELGFVYGGDFDELFVHVTAPEGWELKPTDHSMWSDIIDDKGQKRGSIFYKAAFYDQRAFGRWEKES